MRRWRSLRGCERVILCCGEALIDMLPSGDGFRPSPGGAVYNTALALGRLGVATGLLWPISRDGFGGMLRGPLAEAGVDLSLCPESPRPTTLAFVTFRDGEAQYSFYDEGTAGRDGFAPVLPDHVRALFIGGISLIPDAPAQAVAALVAKAQGRLVMLDPNIRPAMIPDLPAHRARILALAAQATVVKLSAEDIRALWPGSAPETVAAGLLAQGAALVLLTQGAQGATAFRSHAALHRPAPRVAVADSIGAGDCFDAGFLTSLAAQDLLTPQALANAPDSAVEAALDHAIRIAALSLSRPGCNPPWAHEVQP